MIRELVDSYPMAEKIVFVMDNLNTHKMASLYEAFAPDRVSPTDRTAGGSLHAESTAVRWTSAKTELKHDDQTVPSAADADKPTLVREVAAGNPHETPLDAASTGVSLQPTPESNSNASTRQFRSVEAVGLYFRMTVEHARHRAEA